MADIEGLKTQGNQLFQSNKYEEAADKYTAAINALEEKKTASPLEAAERRTLAILYSNRAFCSLKAELYAAAVDDGTLAINTDPSFPKGYYRRGAAHFALSKLKLAVHDFRRVAIMLPEDKDAQAKLKETEKAFQKYQFECAISSDDSSMPSIPSSAANKAEAVNLDTIAVEESYAGPRTRDNTASSIDEEFIRSMLAHMKAQKKMHARYALQVIIEAKKLLKTLPTLVPVQFGEGEEYTVCGDTHGQFYDLLNIFEINGFPSKSRPYVFNGDFVDRGSWSVEVILTMLAFKVFLPDHFHITRGNHESRGLNRVYGFEGEVRAKYSELMYELFQETFNWLPLAITLNSKVLILHGGLFSRDGVKLSEIAAIDRNRDIPESGLMTELLWSDPSPVPGRLPSPRGVGVRFGPDVSHAFLDDNGLDLLVRSHEVKEKGYEQTHGGRVITIFSAPNYCDSVNNSAALIRFGTDLKPRFVEFKAVPHPSIPPMKYTTMGGMY